MDQKYRVIDGGLATEAIDTFGLEHLNKDPLWAARLLTTDPNTIKSIHKSFLESGADVIETSSYQASIKGFMEELSLDNKQSFDLITRSGQIACEVRDQFWQRCKQNNVCRLRPLVAGSLGPYGACLHDGSEYNGHYAQTMSIVELMDWHRPHVKALIASGVDFIAFDTIPASKEAEAIAHLMKEFVSTEAWISFCCKDGHHIASGETFKDALSRLTKVNKVQIRGVGINCTDPGYVTSLLASVPDSVKENWIIVVYPNSGEKWSAEKSWTGRAECRPLGDFVPEWMAQGARWLGGCCRVRPADITHVRTALSNCVHEYQK